MRRLVLIAAVAGALSAPGLAQAAAPARIARPNPVTYPIRLDYVDPLVGADGKPASLAPLVQSVMMAAARDAATFRYASQGDLGGFVRATVGEGALAGGGRLVIHPVSFKPQIPLFARAGGGTVLSYTFAHTPTGPTWAPDNGRVPRLAPPPPPTPGNVPPPANQGFGGRPGGGGRNGGSGGATTTTKGGGHTGGGGGTTTTTQSPPPPPTTTTTGTTTAASGGGGGGGGGGCTGGSCTSGACGVPGLSVDSNLPGCTLTIASAAPGDSVSETFTIQNTSGSAYTLSFMAGGANNNHLWQDLEMDVYDPSGGAPTPPLPSLTSWLGSFYALTTLNPGQTVQYVVVLYLPTTAGNADMGRSAIIDFTWSAA